MQAWRTVHVRELLGVVPRVRQGSVFGRRRGVLQVPARKVLRQRVGCATLRELRLAGNAVDSRGAELLAKLSLEALDVSGTGVCAVGAARLVGARAATRLALDDLALGDTGAALVAVALLQNSRADGDNDDDDSPALLLEDGTARRRVRLETLGLSSNGIGDAGAILLAAALAAPRCTVTTLEFGANANTPDGNAALRDAQTKRPALDVAMLDDRRPDPEADPEEDQPQENKL